MTRRPDELADPVRDSAAPVVVTLLRGGWMVPVQVPRYVAHWMHETIAMLHEARAAAERERAAQVRHWFSGFAWGVGVVALGLNWAAALGLLVLSVVLRWWPEVRAAWQRWRERRVE